MVVPKRWRNKRAIDACAIGAAILPLEKTFFTSII